MENYKQTELGLIPEDWEVKKLGECSSISGDYGINAPAVKFSEDLPTYLRITDIDDDGNYSKENKVSVKDDNSESFILDDEDIVFARTGATVGKTYLHNKKENGDLVFAGFLIRFRTNFDILLPYYLKLYTNTDKYWNWVSVFSMRSGQPGINSKEYSNLKIPLPPLPEQKKIADCLFTWDVAIEKQNALINALANRKKALMQQLLTGKKRLPGFEGKIEFKRLHNLIIEKSERNKELKCNRVLSVTNSQGFINQSEQFGREIASADLSNYKIVRKNQFAYNPSRVNVGSLDLLRNFEEGLLSPMYVVFETKENKLLPEFLFYQLKTWWFNGHIPQYVQGSVRDSLAFEGLKAMSFFIPPIEEQTAIAEILATADRELTLQKEKLAQLQTQKKGLMQVLLTGKKRLIN